MGNEKLVLQLICLIYILAEYIIFPEMWWSQCRVLSAHQRRPIQNSDLLEPWLLNSWALLYWLDDKIFKNDLNICQTALFALVKKNQKKTKKIHKTSSTFIWKIMFFCLWWLESREFLSELKERKWSGKHWCLQVQFIWKLQLTADSVIL